MKFKRSAFGYRAIDVEDYIDELTERHEVELEHKEIEARRLKASIEQLQQRADGYDGLTLKVQELESTNSDLLIRLEEARQNNAQFQSDLARIKSQMQEIEQDIREKESKLEEQRLEVSALRTQLSDVPRLEAMLTEKDNQLVRLTQELTEARSKVKASTDNLTVLEEKDMVISELSERIQYLEREIEFTQQRAVEAEVAAANAIQAPVSVGSSFIERESGTIAAIDELSNYLNGVAMELGQSTLPKTVNEWESFRKMAFSLRGHLLNLASEVSLYRRQERAIAQALIQAEMKAVEMEKEALEDIILKKSQLESEIESKHDELETTKKTINKFRDEMQTVLESYKQRLTLSSISDDQESQE